MNANLTDDQLILLKQLGFMYGWIPCHVRWPRTSNSTARCASCHDLRTQPPRKYFTYHRDRFPVHITPDEEQQLFDVMDPHQINGIIKHYVIIDPEENRF